MSFYAEVKISPITIWAVYIPHHLHPNKVATTFATTFDPTLAYFESTFGLLWRNADNRLSHVAPV